MVKMDYGNNLSYKEIAAHVSEEFNVECSEKDVFNYYEPTLEEEVLSNKIHYKILGF